MHSSVGQRRKHHTGYKNVSAVSKAQHSQLTDERKKTPMFTLSQEELSGGQRTGGEI